MHKERLIITFSSESRFLSYLHFHMQQSDMLKSAQEERVLGTFVFFRYFFIYSWMAEFIIDFIWITKTERSLVIDYIHY